MDGFRLLGASVRGEGHAARNTPCEDAFARRQSREHIVVAVADGVGSCPHAQAGARAATRAAVEAAALWSGAPEQVADVIKMIHASWRLRLYPHTPSDASTTCLVAVARTGSTLLAQLGDGLITYSTPEAPARLDTRDSREFCNETASLATARSAEEWSTIVLPFVPDTVVLATDGVADDLEPGTDAQLLDYFAELVREPAGLPIARLSRDLRHWSTPGATDDRTIAGWSRTEVGNEDRVEAARGPNRAGTRPRARR